ncbi:MAG: 50S ribosomal protein L17 [Planctomycetes bacterium]|nr:50S ribosomal protein L17 [Planctomycetota bacterium]
MRHSRRTNKLGRKTGHRLATERSMVTSLFTHERVITTVPKAKEFRRAAEKLITLARSKSLHNMRQALSALGNDKQVVRKLFEKIGPRFATRNGGYTRVLKLDRRRLGDNAPLAILELVEKSSAEELAAEKQVREQRNEERRQERATTLQRKKKGRSYAACETRRPPRRGVRKKAPVPVEE